MENANSLIGEYSKERLEALSLHELRNIGRQVGVRLPTTLPIAELIKNILAVVTGKQPAYIKKTKQGRPPKALVGNQIFKRLLPDSYYGNNLFDIDVYANAPNDGTLKSGEFAGVLDILVEGYGLVRCSGNMIIYISSHIILANNLRNGDAVTVFAREISESRPWAVAEVRRVNNVAIGTFLKENRQRFEQMPVVAASVNLKTKATCDICKNIKYGNKVLISYSQASRGSSVISSFAKNISVDVLLIDSHEQDIDVLSKIANVEALKVEEKFDTVVSRAKLFLDSAVRKAEKGENVVLVIDSLSKLFKNFNAVGCEGGKVMLDRVDSTAIFNQKKFFNTAKNTDKGSLTIIGLINCKDQSRMDEFLFNELISLTDVYIDFENNKNNFVKK